MIGPPDKSKRHEILSSKLSAMPLEREIDLDTVAMVTNGYVGADLTAVCSEAAYLAIAESQGSQDIRPVSKQRQ